MTVLELLGSSDSEAVSEVDFCAMNAETSEDEKSSAHSAEDLYSDAASESGQSSASNYEMWGIMWRWGEVQDLKVEGK